MNKGHPFYNYYQTILQRLLLTTSHDRSFSPPPPPSAAKIAYESTDQPISFKINISDKNGVAKRKEEAMKKAQEVAQASS